MKNRFAYMAALMLALCACQPMGDDIVLQLTTEDPETLLYTNERQVVKVYLDCNRSWTASCSEDWIELETTKGEEGEAQDFRFVLIANKRYSYRTGEIVIKAGDRDLVLTVTQEPEIMYCVKENFDSSGLLLEGEIPRTWVNVDFDSDGYVWRCWRDPETEQTFAYSASYDDSRARALTPDNWLLTPVIYFPEPSFSVKWDARSSDADYTGDKYEVWVLLYDETNPLSRVEKIFEGTVDSATELTHHEISLAKYDRIKIRIGFRHCESTGLSRVLITNVEVSNLR